MMQAFDTVTIDELVALPPTIFGSIRWKKYIGRFFADLARDLGHGKEHKR